MSPRAALIAPPEAGAWFPRIAAHLGNMAASSRGRFRRSDIEDAISAGRMQLWLALDGADVLAVILTEIVIYPRLKSCRLVGAVGEQMPRWLPLMDDVRAWAAARGCGRMEALSRPGWQRVLAPLGYRPFHVLLEGEV